MSPRKAAKKAAYQAAQQHGDVVTGVWVDEVPRPPRDVEAELEQAKAADKANEERIESAVTAAMERAARAGLGNRGRIRAGHRAMTKEQQRITKERGL